MTPTPPNTELAACPFCGAQAYLVKTQSLVQKSDYHPRTQANEQWTVGCGGENKCISHSQHVSRKDEVIAFWNTRPTISGELGVIIETVNKQAEDDGLWFCAKTAPEAYLQQELRKLHTVCEAALKNPSDAGVRKLWLWKNGEKEYWAFESLYPTYDGGDPQVLGEPAGYALLKPSVAQPTPPQADTPIKATQYHKFEIGDRVTKVKGSRWTGRVVGYYSTELTPNGYCIESETETGSVQIYPEAAIISATPQTDKAAQREDVSGEYVISEEAFNKLEDRLNQPVQDKPNLRELLGKKE